MLPTLNMSNCQYHLYHQVSTCVSAPDMLTCRLSNYLCVAKISPNNVLMFQAALIEHWALRSVVKINFWLLIGMICDVLALDASRVRDVRRVGERWWWLVLISVSGNRFADHLKRGFWTNTHLSWFCCIIAVCYIYCLFHLIDTSAANILWLCLI